jgi:type I restriction enzyme S subunit
MVSSKNVKPFIPISWVEKTFGEIATFINGKAYKQEELLPNGKYKVLRVGNFFTNEGWYYSDLELDEDKYVVDGDLMYAWSASFGPRYWEGEKTIYHYHIWKVIPSKLITKEFLFYLLTFNTEKIFSSKQGGTMFHITKGDMEKRKSIIPPISEQKCIALILGLMDNAINKNNQLIAQKELRKKWLMKNLLTGKKRLKGFDEKWKKLGAGEVFKSITIKGFENEELLSATQDRGIIPRNMLEGRVTMPNGTTTGYKLVEPGDFVISLRSFQGGIEYSYYRGIVSPAYTVLKPKLKINEEFYKQYYKSYDFIGHLAVAVIGIRDGKQISYDDFCSVDIPYPSFEEQTAIAQVLQAVDKEIQLLKTKTEKLREQKKGMMQVLLTGKKRLSGEV